MIATTHPRIVILEPLNDSAGSFTNSGFAVMALIGPMVGLSTAAPLYRFIAGGFPTLNEADEFAKRYAAESQEAPALF